MTGERQAGQGGGEGCDGLIGYEGDIIDEAKIRATLEDEAGGQEALDSQSPAAKPVKLTLN